MIRFALRCGAGHRFEGWFASGDAFEKQAASGAIACPVCGSHDVSKALMAPSLGGRGGEEAAAAAPETAAPPAEELANAQTQMLGPDPRTQALVEAVRRLRRHVTAAADYVGDRFAEEARRIHYEEAERRSIYGEASAEDARALADEGIEVQPLPRLPDERN